MEYMNPPEPHEWTPEEICREALAIGERRAAKVFGLRLADIRQIVRQMQPDCPGCLWEYMCDWSGEDCRYTPEKGVDDDQRDVDPVHGR